MTDASRSHVIGRLAVAEERVRFAVDRRRRVDPDPDDGFRGLYLADHHVDALLATAAADPLLDEDPAGELLLKVEAAADAAGEPSRLRTLASSFGLNALDVDLLVIVALPDIDARFEKLYGYLHDDVTQKRATIGLALELSLSDPTDAAARARFESGSPLVAGGLIEIEPDFPFLRRILRVPDRVISHLLGGDGPEAELSSLLVGDVAPLSDDAVGIAIGRALSDGVRLCALVAADGSDPYGVAAGALRRTGMGALVLDLDRLGGEDDVGDIARVAQAAARDALMRQAGIVAGPYDALARRGPEAVRCFAELPAVTILIGRETWDPLWSRQVALLAETRVPTHAERAAAWAEVIEGADEDALDAVALTAQFRLGAREVARAATSARQQAIFDGGLVGRRELLAGARAQNGVGLEKLARRIVPDVGWDDLVLPANVLSQLKDLANRAKHRDTVLSEWGMRRGGGRGRGISGLFAGDSGTGKTLSAEVLAGSLGLDLYAVNLATVVDKYIGETEKNLERIFTEADGVNGVLLFDEADALFGKRSEVKDARDRYANIEVAYLLQRMESFNGLALLSSNLKTNLDDAFARRLDAVIDFPEPEEEDRWRLWDICLGTSLPRGPDVDLDFLARSFRLSGGNIRSVVTGAAYLAAAQDGRVGMAQLITSVQDEYRKLGRLIVGTEFGGWL